MRYFLESSSADFCLFTFVISIIIKIDTVYMMYNLYIILMSFANQLDDIFNIRRLGLLENEMRQLEYSRQELNEAYNGLYQLCIENNILFSIKVKSEYIVPYGYLYPYDVNITAIQFAQDINAIFELRNSGREPDNFDISNHDIQDAANTLVLELGKQHAISILITVNNMNNNRRFDFNPPHWQPSEPSSQTNNNEVDNTIDTNNDVLFYDNYP